MRSTAFWLLDNLVTCALCAVHQRQLLNNWCDLPGRGVRHHVHYMQQFKFCIQCQCHPLPKWYVPCQRRLIATQVSQMQCHSADGETGIDTLSVERQAWKVQFDRMGALLATSAVDGDSSNVCVWELNPQGQWYLLSRIVGEPQETSAGTMLE